MVDLDLKVPMVGGGLLENVLQAPAFDLLMQISTFKRSAGLFVKVTSKSGIWTIGTTVKKGSTVIGELAEIQTIGADTYLNLIGVLNPLVDTDAITADSGGTATVSGAPNANAFAYVFTSKCSEQKTATVRWYEGNILNVATGVRLDFTLDAKVSGSPELSFKGMGLYNEPVDLTITGKKPPINKPPLVVNAGLKVGSYSPIAVESFNLSAGVAIKEVKDMNHATGLSGFYVDDRVMKGSFDPAVRAMSEYNPYDKWKQGVLSQITAQFGSVAGNSFRCVLPSVQYRHPDKSAQDGKMKYNQEFAPIGNDDREFILFAM